MALGWPESNKVTIKSLAKGSAYHKGSIRSVELLGYGKLKARQDSEGLTACLPQQKAGAIAPVLKIKR